MTRKSRDDSLPIGLTIRRGSEDSFVQNDRRTMFLTRDLGAADATDKGLLAEVNRAQGPCPEGGLGMHSHDVQFQFNYVLSGWVVMGFGEPSEHLLVRLETGDAWLQGPHLVHSVREYSSDYEHIEVIMPAEFPTRFLE